MIAHSMSLGRLAECEDCIADEIEAKIGMGGTGGRLSKFDFDAARYAISGARHRAAAYRTMQAEAVEREKKAGTYEG